MAMIEGYHCPPLPGFESCFRTEAFFVATDPADSAFDWSHMKTYSVTPYSQFYNDLSKQALLPFIL